MKSYIYGQLRTLPDRFSDFLDPARMAVISIDMHEGHLSEDPDCPCPAPRMREIAAPIDRFTTLARAAGIPVIHVRSTLRRGGVDDIKATPSAWRRTFELHVGPIANADMHAIEGTRWTEFAIHVADEDFVVSGKKRLSAFYPTDLELLLRSLECRIVVLTGGLADCCVLNTAFDAANRDFRVVVPADLVRGTNEEMEDAALKMISLHLGLVVDSSDLAALWASKTA